MLIGGAVFLGLFLGIGLYGVYSSRPGYEEKKTESDLYYAKYAIVLKGVIVGKRPDDTMLPNNHFTYTVKIASCNVREHDLREYNEPSYLVIKNDTARFRSHASLSGEPGDSIIVNYIKKKQFTWHGEEELQEYDLPTVLQ